MCQCFGRGAVGRTTKPSSHREFLKRYTSAYFFVDHAAHLLLSRWTTSPQLKHTARNNG
jgi:hypothetical protein